MKPSLTLSALAAGARLSLGLSLSLSMTLTMSLSTIAQAAPAMASTMGCLIEPERTTDVGSPVIGVIERIEVDRGQVVRRGQVLAVLRANVERATLNVASSRADSDAEFQAASASAKFNRERLVRAEDLFRQQFISEQALDQTRTESRLAEHKLAQAQEQRQVSQQERGVAAAQLSQRVIRSPMDGVVAERYVSAGERVDDKPLLRIARVDPLRVQLVVPISMYGQVQQSGSAHVMPELPGATARQARVTMIDKVIDPASNTFRVQLELPNADHTLPAGLRCKAEFAMQAQAAPAASGALRSPAASGALRSPTAAAAPTAAPALAPAAVPPAAAPNVVPRAGTTVTPNTPNTSSARSRLAGAAPSLKLTPMIDAEPVLARGPEEESAVIVTGHVRRVALRPRANPSLSVNTGRAVPAASSDVPSPAPQAPSPEPGAPSGATRTALVAEPGGH